MRFAILDNFLVDLFPIVIVVGERIMDLSKAEVWKFRYNFFWRQTMLQHIGHDRSNGKASPVNHRAATTSRGVGNDMRMGNFRHESTLFLARR